MHDTSSTRSLCPQAVYIWVQVAQGLFAALVLGTASSWFPHSILIVPVQYVVVVHWYTANPLWIRIALVSIFPHKNTKKTIMAWPQEDGRQQADGLKVTVFKTFTYCKYDKYLYPSVKR